MILGGNSAELGSATFPIREDHVRELLIMFPGIGEESVRYDLGKTGSIQVTTENILRLGGTLPPPPQVRSPSNQPSSINDSNSTTGRNQRAGAGASASASGSQSKPVADLLTRYSIDPNMEITEAPENKWDMDPEKRAEIFNKKKEYMVLQARKRFLEKQEAH
ncbi:Coupling of ubiquitin conjugation to ER degradation protein 1 [Smittium mucronatum]|uniref:Coupling of ubiquitin conjugation to ER degradation protein 1 n=1 Tax=Smittium mucronatum TaxID=133383 RepID=A0A1R0GM59_9FUNG|nr:Coupling of ubiquitin conjugation to ER degradation protein 1 [Smittium mucronatum]